MPEIPESTQHSQTLAQKLTRLRELKAPRGGRPPSYEVIAREISATGVSISAPYIWELCTGKTTTPKTSHLEGLARYFGVPVSYLIDDEVTKKLDPQLSFLEELKDKGVYDIAVQLTQGHELSSSSLETLKTMIEQLQNLEGRGFSTEVREEQQPES
ncbi:helix-turn-helix domain-containing protein [Streptomyces sp. PTM05]|uniref:Helix-turn-helix domain-containing protein n=1 Tax=Streptantibioticus parmotrematis TaxID=2873249 RepID=A0ABS7QVP5_9ACTN|nr:helix-turn-helix transcriptional regulator [Streptantibioticus parmotrematis]MBY8887286.1 helix-turn-helix domain-containing protein [Streptantibioticus parmotrematis]